MTSVLKRRLCAAAEKGKNMSISRRIGRGLFALLPTGVFLAVQYVFIILVSSMVMTFILIGSPGADAQALGENAMDLLMGSVMDIQVVAQILTLLVTAPWFFFRFVYKKGRSKLRYTFRPGKLAGMLLLGFGFYLAVNYYMLAVDRLLPVLMDEYEALVEMSGIGGLTLMSTAATLVLAPLGEEIVYRGLTLRYLERAGLPFWTVNLLQAALFGFVHLNWVQGGYAFLLGLVLGCIYRKSGSLAAPMILHMLFNFCGTYLAGALVNVPDTWMVNAVLAVLAAACTAAGLYTTCAGPRWDVEQE